MPFERGTRLPGFTLCHVRQRKQKHSGATRPEGAPGPGEAARGAIQRFLEDRYRKFLDERVPMLGDITPRQAARKCGLRPRLIELMNHKHGTFINLDWILDKLGLEELRSRM